jgi:acetyltransferase-like isoleucine patch superfamily enzyme
MWPADFPEALTWTRQTPWKAANELRRLAIWPWIRIFFAWKGIEVGQAWRIYGTPVVQRHRGSRIDVGDWLELRSWRWSNPLVADHRVLFATWSAEAHIQIGDRFRMTGGTICALDRVLIGDDVIIGANCVLADTDFHPLGAAERLEPVSQLTAAPITIGDNVFIGARSMILKGVTVGRGAVIGAGSIVTRSIPSNVVAAGNPAAVVGEVPPSPR